MNNKLKSATCIVITMFVMSACTGNKIESALNKEEAAISKYEKKAANNKATAKDFQELQSKIEALTIEFKNNAAEKDITPEQMQRGQQLAERYEHIMMNNIFDGMDESK